MSDESLPCKVGGFSLIMSPPRFPAIALHFTRFYAILFPKGDTMRKLLFILTLILSAFLLSSCYVNWFNEQIEVPWYIAAIPVSLAVVLGVVFYIIIIQHTYVCPHCKTEFQVKWYHFSIGVHSMGKRLAKCPHCGKKSFCRIKRKARVH